MKKILCLAAAALSALSVVTLITVKAKRRTTYK